MRFLAGCASAQPHERFESDVSNFCRFRAPRLPSWASMPVPTLTRMRSGSQYRRLGRAIPDLAK
eukprot:4570893-Alexandrium_andersonii.AAC.1